MEKKITLKLKSERYEAGADQIDIFAAGRSPDKKADKPGELDTVELITEAVMKTHGGRVTLSYDESELSGLDGSSTLLIFDAAEPDTLTMIRSGAVRVTMVFSPGLRHVCRYDNPILPFGLTLMTHSLKNSLPDNGPLEVDYTTELPGGGRARTRLAIWIREAGDEETLGGTS